MDNKNKIYDWLVIKPLNATNYAKLVFLWIIVEIAMIAYKVYTETAFWLINFIKSKHDALVYLENERNKVLKILDEEKADKEEEDFIKKVVNETIDRIKNREKKK